MAECINEKWNRFLYDCYTVIWKCNQISPEELLITLNSINSSIQLIIDYSKDQITFLEIFTKRNENEIWIIHYHKQTDTQRCLPFTSRHPNYCKRNILFCLTRKICAIAENHAKKLKNLENLKSNLYKYHYPDSLIKRWFQIAFSIPQKDLKKHKKSSNKNT